MPGEPQSFLFTHVPSGVTVTGTRGPAAPPDGYGFPPPVRKKDLLPVAQTPSNIPGAFAVAVNTASQPKPSAGAGAGAGAGAAAPAASDAFPDAATSLSTRNTLSRRVPTTTAAPAVKDSAGKFLAPPKKLKITAAGRLTARDMERAALESIAAETSSKRRAHRLRNIRRARARAAIRGAAVEAAAKIAAEQCAPNIFMRTLGAKSNPEQVAALQRVIAEQLCVSARYSNVR